MDIGCGTGVFDKQLFEYGHNVFGVDLSFNILRYGKDLYKNKILYVNADIENIPIKNERMDVIICAGVLSWLKEDMRSISEMLRVQKKGGLIFITLPNRIRIDYLLDPYYYIKFVWNIIQKIRTKNRNTLTSKLIVRKYLYTQIKYMFKNRDFNINQIINLGFGPLTVWRKEILPKILSKKMEYLYLHLLKFKFLRFLMIFSNHWIIELEKTK